MSAYFCGFELNCCIHWKLFEKWHCILYNDIKFVINIWRETMIIFAVGVGGLLLFDVLVLIFRKFYVKDIKKSKLNKYQLWCVGLSGVLTCLNRGNYYSLEIDKKNDERITTHKRILKTSCSITNKNDLLCTLDWLLEDGIIANMKSMWSWSELS